MMDPNPNLHPLKLAAIVYRPDDDVDSLLAGFASDLICQGNRVGGIVQKNTKRECGARELMEVVEWLDEVLLASKHGPPKRAAKDDPLH